MLQSRNKAGTRQPSCDPSHEFTYHNEQIMVKVDDAHVQLGLRTLETAVLARHFDVLCPGTRARLMYSMILNSSCPTRG